MHLGKFSRQHSERSVNARVVTDIDSAIDFMHQLTERSESVPIAEINNQIAELSKEKPAVDWLKKAEEIVDITEVMTGIISGGTVEDKRVYLSRLSSNLIWDEQELSIINTEPIQRLIDGLKQAKAKSRLFEPRFSEALKDKTEAFTSVCPTWCVGQDSNLRSP